jgi:class 3 adenylate cyclase
MLESYLPDLVLQTIEEKDALQDSAFCEKAHCAVVLADISGFTPLTEKYCKEKDGPEKLSEVLNEYFEVMIDIIYMVKLIFSIRFVIFNLLQYIS